MKPGRQYLPNLYVLIHLLIAIPAFAQDIDLEALTPKIEAHISGQASPKHDPSNTILVLEPQGPSPEYRLFSRHILTDTNSASLRFRSTDSHAACVASVAILNNPSIRILHMETTNTNAARSRFIDLLDRRYGSNPVLTPELYRDLAQALLEGERAAIKKAHDLGVRVVNLSYGFSEYDISVDTLGPIKSNLNWVARQKGIPANDSDWTTRGRDVRAFMEVFKQEFARIFADYPDMTFVIAAGNNTYNLDLTPYVPAGIIADNVINVASINQQGKLALNSNHGFLKVQVVAPGAPAIVENPRGGFTLDKGTSFAAPYVAALGTRLRQAHPQISPKEIQEIMIRTSDRSANLRGKVRSDGTLNPSRAVRAAELLTHAPDVDHAIALAWTEQFPRDFGCIQFLSNQCPQEGR